ncbi:MAG: hydrogen gas-evolving membrane-bound hydrogenase subunit E [archaeon]
MNSVLKILTLLVIALFIIVSAVSMRPFGEPDDYSMDFYVIMHTQEETGSNNAVDAVVFDYRGLDTLGEACILFTAATGVFLVFGRTAHVPKERVRDSRMIKSKVVAGK